MINFKEVIAKQIAEQLNMDTKEIEQFIESPANQQMGDYSFPCFRQT